MQKKEYKISGMHCANCEQRIEKAAIALPGVIDVKANAGAGEAVLSVDEHRFEENKWRVAVEELDYEIANNSGKAGRGLKTIVLIAALFAVLLIAYLFVGRLAGVADALAARNKFSVLAAFIIGIVASFSTCLALVGGIILTFSSKLKAEGNYFQSVVSPQLQFHAGRIVTFFFLGGLLGFVGRWFAISTKMNAILILAVAAIMLSFGISNLGFNFRSLVPGAPRRTFAWLDKWKNSKHKAAPAILGAITFFLPCGFTQSMQLAAIAIGSFWPAAWLMAAFALGTAPVLLLLGVVSGTGRIGSSSALRKIVGTIIIVFAIYTAMTAFALFDVGSAGGKVNEPNRMANLTAQEIVMTVDYNGFTPNVFTLKRGVPVRWVINAKGLTGCNSEIIVPSLSLDKKLSYGENIVEFTPTEIGTIKFSCGMRMIRGKFVVTD